MGWDEQKMNRKEKRDRNKGGRERKKDNQNETQCRQNKGNKGGREIKAEKLRRGQMIVEGKRTRENQGNGEREERNVGEEMPVEKEA